MKGPGICMRNISEKENKRREIFDTEDNGVKF